MDVEVTDAQLEELKILMNSLNSARSNSSSATGEITMGDLKVEWVADDTHFTISGENIAYA